MGMQGCNYICQTSIGVCKLLLWNPVIGGQKLDLYRLYFLVTQRGGIEKAVLDGKWREVVAGLNISHAITNRSFVVKKHYFKLLFHYEQVYYFRRQGPIVTPPVTVRQRSYPRFQFVNNSGQAMPLLPQLGFDQGSESLGSVPHHPPLGESQPEDVAPLPEDEEDDNVAESNPVPAVPASVENGIGHAVSGDLPSDPAFGVDAPNAAIGDAAPSFVALSPFRENEPMGAQCFQTNMAAHGIGENMPAGGSLVHNDLGNVNIGSHVLHGVLHSQPLPEYSFSAPSTSAAHPQPCRSSYSFFFEERFSMFRNLPSQSMGEFVRLIEESWGRLTEAERGVYTDRERVDKERYERELNEYQERIRRT